MTQYNRQQTFHLLPLPFDVNDYINSTIIQNKKKEIVKKFQNASYSRKNNMIYVSVNVYRRIPNV